MTVILWALALSALGLAVENAITFTHAKGTIGQRLAACWSNSLTIFIGVWGSILSVGMYGLDALGQITGDPQFTSFADAIKGAIPPQYHPWVPVAALGATMLGRLRTLPKAG